MKLTDALGIPLPIILAPMGGGPGTPELTAANHAKDVGRTSVRRAG